MKVFWKNINYILVFAAVLAAVASFSLSHIVQDPAKSFWINISAGLVTALVTIFGIDGLRQRQVELKKSDIRKTAQEDLQRLSNMFLSYLLGPLEIFPIEQRLQISDDLGENWRGKERAKLLSEFSEKNLSLLVSKITSKKFDELKKNFDIVRSEINEDLVLYGDFLPEILRGELLNTRRSLRNLTLVFELFEPFRFQAGSHSSEHQTIATSLKDFCKQAIRFINTLGGWN